MHYQQAPLPGCQLGLVAGGEMEVHGLRASALVGSRNLAVDDLSGHPELVVCRRVALATVPQRQLLPHRLGEAP